tara:strand:+ start:271 stop:1521 length:1251 start_codon:yes stop_codon:yes gene_type:complete
MGSPASLRDFRFKVGGTFNTAFTNAADAAGGWNTSASILKLRIAGFDQTGLVREGLPDETIQTRMYGRPAPYAGLRKGTLRVSPYLAGAESGITAHPEAIWLNAMMGGCQLPTNARSATVTDGASTDIGNIAMISADTHAVVGQAVLCGVKGDGRGNGEVKIITGIDGAGINVTPETTLAMATGDTVVFSTTVYLDQDAAQKYIDFMAIGHATPDQRQGIGCGGTFTISGIAPGELPKVDTDLMVPEHRWVPSSERGTMSQAAPSGNEPAYDRSIGSLQIQQTDSTATRDLFQGGDFALDPGLALEEIPDLGGVNGVGGYCKVPGAARMEATVLAAEDMRGLVDDFQNRTTKAAIMQFGHAAERTAAFEFQKCHLADMPIDATINNQAGVKIVLEADDDYVSGSELQSSAVRVHMF